MKTAIYTAIFNDYDDLKDPEFVSDRCDYFCFTDNEAFSSEIWNIKVRKRCFKDATLDARMYKHLPHTFLSEYDVTIWVDGCFSIIGDISQGIEMFLQDSDMALYKHTSKNIFDEARLCKILQKESPEKIDAQIDYYKKEPGIENIKICQTPFLWRKNNEKIAKFSEFWWKEIKERACRDQISLPFALMNNKLKCNVIKARNEYPYSCEWCRFYHHKIRRKVEQYEISRR